MAVRVNIAIVFTEDEFEQISFDKQGDIVNNLLRHRDWDIEVLEASFIECNMYEEDEPSISSNKQTWTQEGEY